MSAVETREIISPIEGVKVKPLVTHRDQRGFFREILRVSDPIFTDDGSVAKGNGENFGQWSHSKMSHDVVKAWHYHHRQTDWWYISGGLVQFGLYDNREESPTFKKLWLGYLGDESESVDGQSKIDSSLSKLGFACLKIPPGVLHGARVLSKSAHLFYITSHVYDPNDEGRIPFDSHLVPHSWGEGALVVERDTVFFTPLYPREPLKLV